MLLAIVAVDRFCLRRRPLAADAVWFTTLLVLIFLPLFSLLSPLNFGWQIALVHSEQPVAAAAPRLAKSAMPNTMFVMRFIGC